MPFGAQLTDGGEVRFALWAPGARQVEVLLEEDPRLRLPMAHRAPGWFELTTAAAQAGSRYRYLIDGEDAVPDPASRCNPEGVHGPSVVVDSRGFEWGDVKWRAPAWHEAVIYELHVGTFSPEGSFAGVEARLDHLQHLGVNVIELLPLAAFAGRRGWGYDGVLPFAPYAGYGTPDELKSLVAAAHRRGIAMMLDVVYNHLGPEGNYLHRYAAPFFNSKLGTPWGPAINFDGEGSRAIRDFFIHNALYWLNEYHFDGLRLDAVQAIHDRSQPHFLTEISQAVRTAAQSSESPREIYLVLENGDNGARWLGPPGASGTHDAQWNDDFYRSLHVLLTGETHGFFVDHAEEPQALLCRALAEGLSYQGQISRYHRRAHGEPSAHLPPTAFVNFLQNHDQVGNRAHGERISQLVQGARESRAREALLAASALVLLAPAPPMLFMGEEWAASTPFLFFCDFEPGLGNRVRQGRARELAEFTGQTRTAFARSQMPDPAAESTFTASRLDWNEPGLAPHAQVLENHRRLLAIRRRDIIPLIPQIKETYAMKAPSGAFSVEWRLRDGRALRLITNLSDAPVPLVGRTAGRLIFCTHPGVRALFISGELPPWSVLWLLERASS